MGLLWLRLHRQDERILYALLTRRRRLSDEVMSTLTHLGSASATIGITLFLLGIPDYRPIGVVAGFALVSSHLAVQLLKRSINRQRPRLPAGCASLIEAPDRFSFPSGHAAAALSTALPIALQVSPILGSAIVFLGLLVGVTRCYLGVHYPGDVAAGWILAIAGVLGGLAI